MVVDPWGSVLGSRTVDGEGVLTVELDPRQTARFRAQLPALDHRRL